MNPDQTTDRRHGEIPAVPAQRPADGLSTMAFNFPLNLTAAEIAQQARSFGEYDAALAEPSVSAAAPKKPE